MKAWARQTFDWDRVARQWHDVFQGHLGSQPPRSNEDVAELGGVGDL